jgi:two-component system LytT family response regulator
MKAVIIEDNPLDLKLLASMLAMHHSDVQIEGDAGNTEEGFDLIVSTRPELVFLDIELSDGNSFEILKKLKHHGHPSFHCIVITAHDSFDYTQMAIQFDALDFIIKPIQPDHLSKAIGKALKKVQNNIAPIDLPTIMNYMSLLTTQQSNKKIAFQVVRGAIEVIDSDLIAYMEADDKMTIIHNIDGSKFYASNNIGYYKRLFEHELNFFQIAKNIIVNTKNVKRFDPYETMVTLNNGKNIFASRRGAQEFKKILAGTRKFLRAR